MNNLEAKKNEKKEDIVSHVNNIFRNVLISVAVALIVSGVTCSVTKTIEYTKTMNEISVQIQNIQKQQDKSSEDIKRLYQLNKGVDERLIKNEISMGFILNSPYHKGRGFLFQRELRT